MTVVSGLQTETNGEAFFRKRYKPYGQEESEPPFKPGGFG
jgi:hypothetical protein